MGFLKNSALAATAFLALSANAHMVMKSPVPYGKSTLNNSPLAADGSDFPCKLRSGAFDPEGAQNVMAIGEPQTLSFTGSAVHGGGSCQVALTTDLQPTKDSKWMVIKSIVGGCPANVPGNLPADPNGSGASTFQYTIPDGIAPGEYTIAWSWMNKIGNREFYMNCGPATVVGAKRRRYEPAPKVSKRQSNFPDLCVANLASVNSLTTDEGMEYVFSNGGSDVQTAGQGPFQTLDCGGSGGGAAKPTGVPSGSPSGQPSGQPNVQPSGQPSAPPSGQPTGQPAGQPGFASGPGNSSPATASVGQPNSQPSGAPGVFASGAASSSETLAVVPVADPTKAAPTVATASQAAATGSPSTGNTSSNGTSGSGSQSGSCSDEGAWACSSDGTSFQRCASGQWSAPMQLSSGMKCSPGISSNINMSAAKRHLDGHLRRASFLRSGH